MDAPRRGLVSALSVAVTLLLLTAAPGGGVSATRVRTPMPAAGTVGHAGAAAGAARPLASGRLFTDTALSTFFTDEMILAFRTRYDTLGVSMDELMDAASAGNLAQYQMQINAQRNSTLTMVIAIATYRAIMRSLDTRGRCLDFVRQSTVDDPTSCGVERWRRCCRGTANDADKVLLCAKHENLHVSPRFSLAAHPANSFRVRPLPLHAAVREGMSLSALRRRALERASTLALNSSTAVRLENWEERQATVGLGDKTTARANVVGVPGVAGASAMNPASRPRTVPTTARLDTVLPVYFEDQFTQRVTAAEPDDAWTTWCKEFLFYGAGCVEYCCTTDMAGSAICNTAKDPDGCI